MSLGRIRFRKGSPPWTYPLSCASKSTVSTSSIVLSIASLHSQLQDEFPGRGDVLIPKGLSVNDLQPSSLEPAKGGEKDQQGVKRAWERGKDICLGWSFNSHSLGVYPGPGPALGT